MSFGWHHVSVSVFHFTGNSTFYSTTYRCYHLNCYWITLLSFCEGNQPVNGRFPSERASYPESVYIMMSSWCMLTVKDHVNIIELFASSDTITRAQLRAGNMPIWSVIWQTLVFVTSSPCRKCCNWYYHRNNTNISHFPGNLRLLFLKQAQNKALILQIE